MDVNALAQSINKLDMLAQKMEKVDLVTQKLDQLLAQNRQKFTSSSTSQTFSEPTNQANQEVCVLCKSPTHVVFDYPTVVQLPPFIQEQVFATQSGPKHAYDPYSNTYNAGWKNHPNFSWRN